MNKSRRASLKRALSYLENASRLIHDAKYEEQDALDNMPENLQNSERYEAMESAIDAMEDAISAIDDVRDCIDRAIA